MKKQKNRNTLWENANLSNLSRAGVQAFDITCLFVSEKIPIAVIVLQCGAQVNSNIAIPTPPTPWERFFIWIATTYVQISLAIFKPANYNVVVLHVVRCNFWKSKSNPASGVNSQTKRYFIVLIVKFPPERNRLLSKKRVNWVDVPMEKQGCKYLIITMS